MTGETPEVSIAMSKKVGTPEPILYLQVETPQRLQSASVKPALGCQLVLLMRLETPASAKSHKLLLLDLEKVGERGLRYGLVAHGSDVISCKDKSCGS